MKKDSEKETNDFENQKEEQKELSKYTLKEILTGSVLVKQSVVKQLPFLFFITFLAILYIANRYQAEHLLRVSIKLQEELNELRAESITTTSELMFASRQSQVIRIIHENNLDLKESTTPPRRIKMRN